MTFARGLRAILRQDPDVIMVGEIRDLETAEIAIRASLTGHLVLSTLHTNSAIGAVTRLQDMGVEPFLLSSCLIGVIAQRLVRLLCPQCKQKHRLSRNERDLLRVGARRVNCYHPAGCVHCLQTGFHSRTGIFEVIGTDDTLRTLIHDRAGEADMIKYAQERFSSIRDRGIECVVAGSTSLEEVLRVTLDE